MIQLYNGDCLELMKNIPDGTVDLVLTDPPYGINYQSTRRKDKAKRMPKIKNDEKPFTEFIPEIQRIIKSTGCAMIFTRWDVQNQFIDEILKNGMIVRNVLIWDKKVHGMGDLKRSFGSRYESIIFVSKDAFRFPGKRPQDIIEAQRVSPGKLLHPNEKPIDLQEKLVQQVTKPGAWVLDCFMGSGSTGIACVNTGRNFIGIELDKNYYDIARGRINQAENAKKVSG